MTWQCLYEEKNTGNLAACWSCWAGNHQTGKRSRRITNENGLLKKGNCILGFFLNRYVFYMGSYTAVFHFLKHQKSSVFSSSQRNRMIPGL